MFFIPKPMFLQLWFICA